MAFWAAPGYAVSVVSSQFQSEERDSDCCPGLAFPPLGRPTAPHLLRMSSGGAKYIAQVG